MINRLILEYEYQTGLFISVIAYSSYIVNQLRNSGFWLPSYYPNSWENRLIY